MHHHHSKFFAKLGLHVILCNMYTLEDVVYLAGLIDGEGCIYISKGNTSTGVDTAFSLNLHIANTNENVIRWVADTYGGTVCSVLPKLPGRARQWIWNVCSKNAASVIRLVRPYLKIKQPEADIALKFIELPRGHTLKGPLYLEMKNAKRAYKKYK